MPRRPKLLITLTDRGWKVDVPASLTASGKRERSYYQQEADAKRHAVGIRKRYHQLGTQSGVLSPELAAEAFQAAELLLPFGVSLLAAARDYVARNAVASGQVTVSDAWNAYVTGLVIKKRAEMTIADYERGLKSMPEWFRKLRVADATETLLERALDDTTTTRGPTWNRRLRETRAVLREAVRTKIRAHEVRRRDPEIMSASMARAAMDHAVELSCAKTMAILLFAGVRPVGELGRISEINFRHDYISISGEESKTGDDRHIPIAPNLRAWLDRYPHEKIMMRGWRWRYQAIRKHAGMNDQDVCRHTFASAFYKLHGEQETTAAMGHTSFKTTERFYKRAITQDEARAYFEIYPPDPS
jgi:integrase